MTKGTDALRTARKQLERHTRDEKFLGNAHCILKYFSPKNYAEVDDARAKHGAARSGRGIENKGTARSGWSRPRTTNHQAAPGTDDQLAGRAINRMTSDRSATIAVRNGVKP
jgi:hypothetical protein